MRPTGALHLGHYHGALKNWLRLQDSHDCFFFVADWHALTTQRPSGETLARHAYEMVTDWLAAGIAPERCTLFLQSRMPEHAELFTLLAMCTPSSWLARMPSYKDQVAADPRGPVRVSARAAPADPMARSVRWAGRSRDDRACCGSRRFGSRNGPWLGRSPGRPAVVAQPEVISGWSSTWE